jgi:iron complex outermembrane receptor protein
MMRLLLVSAFMIAFYLPVIAQDSIRSMQDIEVRGFETRRSQVNVPASISTITNRDLQRFSNTSLVPVMNTVAGVRMEERSPGSYRLSIRGSLLRSPFGVRNVKIYWKDIPLTDAGGNTYLNLLDFNGVGQVEILKGPAGSVYGAGTGGVVTLSEPAWTEGKKNRFMAQLNGGSFGAFGAALKWQGGTEKLNWQILQSHYQSDGYRQNSKMRRDLTQGNLNWQTSDRNKIEALVMYGNLAYRTPGGLTLAQMNADPTQARPPTPVVPGAVQQQAGVYNKTFLAGITDTYRFNKHWTNSTTITAAFTNFENPFITNYEKRKEDGLGLRTKFQFSKKAGNTMINWTTGAELQWLFSTIDSTGNIGGKPDNNLVRDKVRSTQQFVFTQLELQFFNKLTVQAGLSINDYGYRIERTIPPSPPVDLTFDLQLVPRLAALYRFTENISLHTSASKGYSPPSLAEVRPSAGGIYSDLQAEHGWNYELGLKGSAWRSRFNFDISVFSFRLEDAIVRRVNAQGSEYFVNAGGTKQNGLEAFMESYLINSSGGVLKQMRIWSSATFFNFKFSDYKVNNNDFSGNELTGVPSEVILAGLDASFAAGFYLNATFNYTSALPLNDANDVFADDYRLWQGRMGWKHKWNANVATEIFAGIDNAGNGLYSLGNDINAFGRRYYNPAPERNYFAGLRVTF